jgi:hypothetical protein
LTSKAKAKFRNTINDMIELHKELDFLPFNEIVLYNDNPAGVYSPRLYSIFQTSCVQVISMMQNIVGELNALKTNSRQGKFEEYYKLLNGKKMLSL